MAALRKQVLRYLLAFLGVAVMASFATRWVASKLDPVFEGEPLSRWMLAGLRGDPNASSNAIVQIGRNGFPFLIRELSAEDNRLKKWIGEKGGYYVWLLRPEWRRFLACKAVATLGQQARSLAPYITNNFSSPIGSLRLAAFEAAAAMRLSDVKHPLTNAVASDGSIWVRVEAAKHLVSLGAVAPEVLDMLVTNSWSRPMTIIALESFASQIERMPISSK
jgi:hypothetical protein